MTAKVGSLGVPRIGIALIWFVDAGANQGGTAPTPAMAPDSKPEQPPSGHGPVKPEDIELVRGLTGLDPAELVARLQEIAAEYARDPDVLRAEILRITGGDELAAEYLVQLIHTATADAEEDIPSGPGEHGEPGEGSGQVIYLDQRGTRNGEDEPES